MKKTIIFGVSLLVFILVVISIAGCTVTQKIVASMSYDNEEGVCTLVNKSQSNYDKFKVFLEVFDEYGNKEDVIKDVGRFNKGEVVDFSIKELAKESVHITRVELKQFSYEPTLLIIFARLLVLLCFILAVLVTTIALCKINRLE